MNFFSSNQITAFAVPVSVSYQQQATPHLAVFAGGAGQRRMKPAVRHQCPVNQSSTEGAVTGGALSDHLQ
jgi:hypothetical protein